MPQVPQTQGRAAGDHRRNRGNGGEVRSRLGHNHRRVLPADDGGRSADGGPAERRVPERGRAERAQRGPVPKAAGRVRDSRGTGRRRPADRQHRPTVPGSLAVHVARVPVVLHPTGTGPDLAQPNITSTNPIGLNPRNHDRVPLRFPVYWT